MTRISWLLLPSAVMLQIFSSAAMWFGADHSIWLFVGRGIAGAAVGLATGSTATLVVAAIGESGRTAVATSAIGGSAVGLLTATAVTALSEQPDHLAYQLHMFVLAVSLVALAATTVAARPMLRRSFAKARVDPPPRRDATTVVPRRQRLAALGIGAAGWAVGGLAAGTIPSIVKEQFSTDFILVVMAAPLLLMSAAWISPRLLRAVRIELGGGKALVLIALGGAALACAVGFQQLWLILVGGLVWGLGQGSAYAYGLSVLTRGLPPVQQGRTASAYAACAYAFTAITVITTGAVSSLAGNTAGMVYAAALLGALCLAVALLGYTGASPVPIYRAEITTGELASRAPTRESLR
ncbi:MULTISPECIES: hypothetical protein [unclassified Rhodococcus (in: high G+C Gram-positive bacteria)]|uniref:hypothetical protein n=1 Tax=unclassified Rhodococcus (in: high G+C Gram-positive bacteria) TaxID=192944 RepID=UPI0015E8A13A|nr:MULTISPECIES: hypothetical protein [unclassified Rhodococcus (in: high G+C Gram-positive bacteria)]